MTSAALLNGLYWKQAMDFLKVIKVHGITRDRFKLCTEIFRTKVEQLTLMEDEAMLTGLNNIYALTGEGACIEFDEQHSRPQRMGTQAPYATATFICSKTRKIIVQGHADEAICKAYNCLSKEKASRNHGMWYLASNLSKIDHFVSDESSGAATSIRTIVKAIPRHEGLQHHYDVWHKQRKVVKKFNAFRNQRWKPRGPYLYPELQKIPIAFFKKHWDYSCENALGSEYLFHCHWLSFLERSVGAGFVTSCSFSYEGLGLFLLETALDEKHYLLGLRTANCESFHAVANMYCPKGMDQTFKMYCCRKSLARLHWNSALDSPEKVWQIKRWLINQTLNTYFE